MGKTKKKVIPKVLSAFMLAVLLSAAGTTAVHAETAATFINRQTEMATEETSEELTEEVSESEETESEEMSEETSEEESEETTEEESEEVSETESEEESEELTETVSEELSETESEEDTEDSETILTVTSSTPKTGDVSSFLLLFAVVAAFGGVLFAVTGKKRMHGRIMAAAAVLGTGILSLSIVYSCMPAKAGTTDVTINGSIIYTEMTAKSVEPEEGDVLALTLERYDGEVWNPAEGVSYVVCDGNGNAVSEVLTTGADGSIVIEKSSDGMPSLAFTDDEVNLNVQEGMGEGDLRLVPDTENTDESWGRIAGYADSNSTDTYSISMSRADTFVYSSAEAGFSVAKEISQETEENGTFTFALEQILSEDGNGNILEAEPAVYVSYAVYDTASDEKISGGMTGEDGTFTLSGGQYAALDLESGCSWTVAEAESDGWDLEEIVVPEDEYRNWAISIPAAGTIKLAAGPEINTAFAIYSADDDSLTFYCREMTGVEEGGMYEGKTVTSIYTGIDMTDFENAEDVPWVFDGTYEDVVSVAFADTVSPVSTAYWFYEFTACTEIDLTGLDTSDVEDMAYMFYYCENLEKLDVSSFNTSKVTNMECMFRGCSGLTSLDVSGFNTSRTALTSYMFGSCSNLTELDVSGFDTSRVVDMQGMFYYCEKLTALDVSGFDTANAELLDNMFAYCSSLTSIDVSSFDTSNVTAMGWMFFDCESLESLDVSSFDTSSVTDMIAMFAYCKNLEELDLGDLDTSHVTRISSMFQGCSSLTALDVSSFDTSSATNMRHMFNGCSDLTSLDVSGFDTSNVTDMSGMFGLCSSLTVLDLRGFDTANVTDMDGMFKQSAGLVTIYADDSWSTANVTSSVEMFTDCVSLVGGNGTAYDSAHTDADYACIDTDETPGYFTGEQTDGEEPAVTAFAIYSADDNSLTFYNRDMADVETGGTYEGKTVTAVYTGFDTKKYGSSTVPWNKDGVCNSVASVSVADTISPISTAYWFSDFVSCVEMDLGNLDTSRVTSMRRMFFHCTSLASLDLGSFDTSSVTDMSEMFFYCLALTELDISNFDTSSVTDMSFMFWRCWKVSELDISNFNTSNVTNMESMFYGCNSVQVLNVEGFDTSNVTDMSEMFRGCNSLTGIDVSNFNTASVTDMNNMFRNCETLEFLDLSGFDTKLVTDMNGMFYGCTELKSLNISSFDTSSVENMNDIGDELNRIEGQMNYSDNKEEFYRMKNEIGREICKYVLDTIDSPDTEWDISFLMDDSDSNYYDKFQINGGENGALTFLPPVMMETEEGKRLLADMMLGKEVFSDTNRQGQSWSGGPAGPIFNGWANLQNSEYVNSRELKELFDEYENLKEKYGELLDMPVNAETTYTFREAIETGYTTADSQEHKGLLRCISEMQDKNEEKVQEYVNKGLSRSQAQWAESHTNAHDDFHSGMQQYAQISEEQLMKMANESNPDVAYYLESVLSSEETVGIYVQESYEAHLNDDYVILGSDIDNIETLYELYGLLDNEEDLESGVANDNGTIIIPSSAIDPDRLKDILTNRVVRTVDDLDLKNVAEAIEEDAEQIDMPGEAKSPLEIFKDHMDIYTEYGGADRMDTLTKAEGIEGFVEEMRQDLDRHLEEFQIDSAGAYLRESDYMPYYEKAINDIAEYQKMYCEEHGINIPEGLPEQMDAADNSERDNSEAGNKEEYDEEEYGS